MIVLVARTSVAPGIGVSDGKPLRDFPESTRRHQGRFGRGIARLQKQRAELVVEARREFFGGTNGPDQSGLRNADRYAGRAEKRVHGPCGVLAMLLVFTGCMPHFRAMGPAFGQQRNMMLITCPDG